MKPKPSERQIQAAVLAYLGHHRHVAWVHRMNTGAMTVPETKTSKRRFVRFAFPGCADVLGQLKTGEILAIEVKKPGKKATEQQVSFIERVNTHGGCAGVVSSIEDVEALLERHQRMRLIL